MVSVTRIVCCFRVAESMRGEEDVEKQMTNEFILQHLIELAKTLDLADEVGR